MRPLSPRFPARTTNHLPRAPLAGRVLGVPMDPSLFDRQLASVQAAFAADASAEARQAGLDACRSLLATLQPGSPPASPTGTAIVATAGATAPTQGQLEAMIGLLHQ